MPRLPSLRLLGLSPQILPKGATIARERQSTGIRLGAEGRRRPHRDDAVRPSDRLRRVLGAVFRGQALATSRWPSASASRLRRPSARWARKTVGAQAISATWTRTEGSILHSDTRSTVPAPSASARVVPPSGGRQSPASASDRQDCAAPHEIVVHSSLQPDDRIGTELAGYPRCATRRANPANGRPSSTSARTPGSSSMGIDEAGTLAKLLEHATRPDRVYQHAGGGDLVMWDNRCVLHRGRGQRASPTGDAPTTVASDGHRGSALWAGEGHRPPLVRDRRSPRAGPTAPERGGDLLQLAGVVEVVQAHEEQGLAPIERPEERMLDRVLERALRVGGATRANSVARSAPAWPTTRPRSGAARRARADRARRPRKPRRGAARWRRRSAARLSPRGP